MNKKGELTSSQIVMIVIALVGFFVVALFFMGIWELHEETTDKELCKLSILERAHAPAGKAIIPLQCTTEKICITGNKKEGCKQFAGEEVRTVVINLNDVEKSAKKIEEEIAYAIYSCWAMTGEGKLDILGEESVGDYITKWLGLDIFGSGVSEPACIICSRIAIGDDVKTDENKILGKVNVNKYLSKTKVPGSSQTYLELFTDGGVRNLPIVPERNSDSQKKLDDFNEALGIQNSKGSDQLAIIFSQMLWDGADGFEKGMLAAGIVTGASVIIGVALIATGVGAVAGVAVIAKGVLIGAAAGGVIGLSAGISTEFEQYQNQILTAGHCGKIEGAPNDGQMGCSFVKTIGWDVEVVNKLCPGGIEGNL